VKSHRAKILVIRGGAIGDFILTLPAIAAMRSQFPQAHLEVLGYPHIVQLALAGGLVDQASSIEARSLAGFFARNGTLSEDLADYFSEFDLIVSYLYDPDEIFKTNVARCSLAQFIACPHRPDERARMHASRVYLKPLERLAIFEADPVPRLVIPGANQMTLEEPAASASPDAASGSTGNSPPGLTSRQQQRTKELAGNPLGRALTEVDRPDSVRSAVSRWRSRRREVAATRCRASADPHASGAKFALG
jgi:hypothetical protein